MCLMQLFGPVLGLTCERDFNLSVIFEMLWDVDDTFAPCGCAL